MQTLPKPSIWPGISTEHLLDSFTWVDNTQSGIIVAGSSSDPLWWWTNKPVTPRDLLKESRLALRTLREEQEFRHQLSPRTPQVKIQAQTAKARTSRANWHHKGS